MKVKRATLALAPVDEYPWLTVGATVKHRAFGVGKVTVFKDDARVVVVAFPCYGDRVVLTVFAEVDLKPVPRA